MGERAVERLKQDYVSGRIEADELEARLPEAFASSDATNLQAADGILKQLYTGQREAR